MDQPFHDPTKPEEAPKTSTPRVSAARYSLREIMEEVRAERKVSALGRELIDVHEIEKMFSKRRRIKKS
ncbi:hypothetical protein [Coraliomargarita akajimensis]|uniref:Uncharacterized protein n=1 Tax=Coraliomargarita akajimensis (strain DSM 45221 / IAM 15411 / JCM 23193 / KCTC 12865 / 04OKA010-24) TaxID=583355 RepID=D5EQB0_CORAD|nr:hypothetical protein [Coraliomargarita akajimensis]ADE53878.1 hypothetical protein Caka_0855 [Coraliomargarita akajimensis DSM 45221]